MGVGEHTGGARLSCNGDSRTGKELEWLQGSDLPVQCRGAWGGFQVPTVLEEAMAAQGEGRCERASERATGGLLRQVQASRR